LVLALFLSAVGCSAHYHTLSDGRVDFYLTAPAAQSVSLVVLGDAFKQVSAARNPLGTWKVSLLAENEFKYFYLVDGKIYLPECPLRERDDFGSNNCIYSP
jgi:hypothetical protein